MSFAPPRLATVALASAAVLALGACGSKSKSSSSTSAAPPATSTAAAAPATSTAAAAAAPAASGGSTVKLSAAANGSLSFNTMKLTAKAGTVTLQMANPSGSGVPHGISIEGNGVDKDGKVVQPGGTSTVTATLKPGKYTFYCPVPGHEAAGMKGTLTVT